MSCSCGKNRPVSTGKSTRVSGLHSVRPGESCIFCAEKHFGTALTKMVSQGTRPLTALQAVGDLEAARRHCIMEFSAVAEKLGAVITTILMFQSENLSPLLDEISVEIGALIESINPDKESTVSNWNLSSETPLRLHPAIGVLHFMTAGCLGREIGYAGANRSMMLGDLVQAELNLNPFLPDYTNLIRDARHAVQRHELSPFNEQWDELSFRLLATYQSNFSTLIKSAGSDFSMYFSLPKSTS